MLQKIVNFLSTGIITAFGAFAQYVYYISKGKKFRVSTLLTNIVLGFFIGNVVGSFVPVGTFGRDGVLLIAGFGLWPILVVLDEYGWKFVLEKMGFSKKEDQ